MGVVGDMSVASNLVMKGYRRKPITHGGLLDPRRIIDFAKRMIDSFKIATPTPDTHVKFLSGGNIQKTILAREIDSCGGVLVAAYPSRGLDVGATEAVRNEMVRQRDKGSGVLLVSEDLDELLSVADKIVVMFEGQSMGELNSTDADVEMLGLMMSGVSKKKAEKEYYGSDHATGV